jgi:hypothetical protein
MRGLIAAVVLALLAAACTPVCGEQADGTAQCTLIKAHWY